MLSPSACRTGIAALLATVPNVGNIHSRRRIMRTEAEVKARLMDANLGYMIGWFISPEPNGTTQTERGMQHYGIGVKGGGNDFTTFRWQIEGYRTLDDAAASEEGFTDLAWAIADEFNAYGVIPSVTGAHLQDAADVAAISYAVLAGAFLMHYARITVGFRGRTRGGP